MTNRVPYVDDMFYHFGNEEEGVDAILDRAFDRWEQLGSGSTPGPLCQFNMQSIGRRCRWQNVLERA